MSPSKPLTEKQRYKRKLKRAGKELFLEIAQHNRQVQMPDGTMGFFVPIRRDPRSPGISLGRIRH